MTTCVDDGLVLAWCMSRDNTAERFWSKVAIVDDDTSCWEWQAARLPSGYGRFGKNDYAHRVAYEDIYGPIPAGMYVCHECDNPSCVRPDHLFAGTAADNNQDASRKGRSRGGVRRGEQNNKTRLTEQDVRAIRAEYASGVSQTALAQRYPVGQQAISRIVARHTWAHVP